MTRITKEFKIDYLNTVDDSLKVKEFCLNLDFKTIVPQLIIKSIVNPLSITVDSITKNDIELLKQWNSVRASVRASDLGFCRVEEGFGRLGF